MCKQNINAYANAKRSAYLCFSPSTVTLYALMTSTLVSCFTKHAYSPSLAAVTGDMVRDEPSSLTVTEPSSWRLTSLPVFRKKIKLKNMYNCVLLQYSENSGGSYGNITRPLNCQVMGNTMKSIWNERHGSCRMAPGTTRRCVHEES